MILKWNEFWEEMVSQGRTMFEKISRGSVNGCKLSLK